jgi:hypothetical protein
MSYRGIIYNDPLQFGLGDSMDLLDFSNARYADADIDRTSDDSPVMRNYSDLSRFYSTFGLGHISERISKGIRWFDLMQDREMLTDMIDFIEDGKDVLTTLDNLDSTPKAVYYASNARAVQLPNIAQTPHNGDYLLVFSLEPLTAEQIDEYELTPIYQA